MTWRPKPNWALTGAAYFDVSKNVILEGDHGKRYSLIAVAEYLFSKRTQMVVTLDYNKVSGAASGKLASQSSQVGIGTGIRQIFLISGSLCKANFPLARPNEHRGTFPSMAMAPLQGSENFAMNPLKRNTKLSRINLAKD